MVTFVALACIFDFLLDHPLMFALLPLFFFLLPVFPAIAREREQARRERERAERRKAEAARKKAAAEEKQRKAEEKQAAEAAAPKRGPGRPRKHPAPDPDAPKRKPGRPRKNPAPAQRPEIISSPEPVASASKPMPEEEEAKFLAEFYAKYPFLKRKVIADHTPEEFLNLIA